MHVYQSLSTPPSFPPTHYAYHLLPPHRTTMSCCERHHSPGSFMSESSLMGVCSWTSDYFDKPVKYDGTTTEKIGIFTVKW